MALNGMKILVGTTKGAFLISDDDHRRRWQVKGLFCDGWRVARLTSGLMDEWAANDLDFAAIIDWIDEPLPFADEFSQVWSLGLAHGTLYAGTKPVSLLTSLDGGRTWERIRGLSDHPSTKSWNPGAAGLVLHTIVSDPSDAEKLWIGISAVGVFATEDAGKTWERRNRLSKAEGCGQHNHPAAPRDGETGHCVHIMMRAPGSSDLLVPAKPSWRVAVRRRRA